MGGVHGLRGDSASPGVRWRAWDNRTGYDATITMVHQCAWGGGNGMLSTTTGPEASQDRDPIPRRNGNGRIEQRKGPKLTF